MTKEEFKQRWESNNTYGGITFRDIADCAVEWRLSARPMTEPIMRVTNRVLMAAGVDDLWEEENEE